MRWSVGVALCGLLLAPAAARAQVRDTLPPDTIPRDTVVRLDTLSRRPAADSAPGLVQRLGIDRLQLAAMGASFGVARPARAEPTEIVSLFADYGELSPRWRVVFSVSYWRSEIRESLVRVLADSIGAVVGDPPGSVPVNAGPVRISTLALNADARYSPLRGRRVRPYAGAGIGAYATDIEGRPISGTFVERNLDNINAGLAGFAGLDLRLLPNLSLDMHARYDLLSGSRYGSVRAGAAYLFGQRGRT